MYERMLDKQHMPTDEEFLAHCGKVKDQLIRIDDFSINELKCERLLRFPYGNEYGWGIKYFIKNKHICDLFAEKDAFTIMIRLSNKQFDKHYDEYSDYTKKQIDTKYPCGEGGWIHYRVSTEEYLNDAMKLLQTKLGK